MDYKKLENNIIIKLNEYKETIKSHTLDLLSEMMRKSTELNGDYPVITEMKIIYVIEQEISEIIADVKRKLPNIVEKVMYDYEKNGLENMNYYFYAKILEIIEEDFNNIGRKIINKIEYELNYSDVDYNWRDKIILKISETINPYYQRMANDLLNDLSVIIRKEFNKLNYTKKKEEEKFTSKKKNVFIEFNNKDSISIKYKGKTYIILLENNKIKLTNFNKEQANYKENLKIIFEYEVSEALRKCEDKKIRQIYYNTKKLKQYQVQEVYLLVLKRKSDSKENSEIISKTLKRDGIEKWIEAMNLTMSFTYFIDDKKLVKIVPLNSSHDYISKGDGGFKLSDDKLVYRNLKNGIENIYIDMGDYIKIKTRNKNKRNIIEMSKDLTRIYIQNFKENELIIDTNKKDIFIIDNQGNTKNLNSIDIIEFMLILKNDYNNVYDTINTNRNFEYIITRYQEEVIKQQINDIKKQLESKNININNLTITPLLDKKSKNILKFVIKNEDGKYLCHYNIDSKEIELIEKFEKLSKKDAEELGIKCQNDFIEVNLRYSFQSNNSSDELYVIENNEIISLLDESVTKLSSNEKKQAITLKGANQISVEVEYKKLSELKVLRYSNVEDEIEIEIPEEDRRVIKKIEEFFFELQKKSESQELSPMKLVDDKVEIQTGITYHRVPNSLEQLESISQKGILASEWFGILESEREGCFCTFTNTINTEKQISEFTKKSAGSYISLCIDTNNEIYEKLLRLDYFNYKKIKAKGTEYLEKYYTQEELEILKIIEKYSDKPSEVEMDNPEWKAIVGGIPSNLINGVCLRTSSILFPKEKYSSEYIEKIIELFPNATIFYGDGEIIHRPKSKQDVITKLETIAKQEQYISNLNEEEKKILLTLLTLEEEKESGMSNDRRR